MKEGNKISHVVAEETNIDRLLVAENYIQYQITCITSSLYEVTELNSEL